MMDQVLSKIGEPAYAAGGVAIGLILCGSLVLSKITADSPIAPYVLQILGMTFILPVVLVMGMLLKLDPQAIVGLLGTIVGYIFGTSKVESKSSRSTKTANDGTETNEEKHA